MRLISELKEQDQVLIVCPRERDEFADILGLRLKEYHSSVTRLHSSPEEYSKYKVCFFVNTKDVVPTSFIDQEDKKIIFISMDDVHRAELINAFVYENKLKNIKVISVESSVKHYTRDVDTALWFVFTNSNDSFLHIYHQPDSPTPKKVQNKKKGTYHFKGFTLTVKKAALIFFSIVLISHLLFIFPLFVASYLHYELGISISKGQLKDRKLNVASSALSISSKLYKLPQYTLRIFSLALPIDRLFELNSSANLMFRTLFRIKDNSESFTNLINRPGKNITEINQMYTLKKEIFIDLKIISKELPYLAKLIPDIDSLQPVAVKISKLSGGLQSLIGMENHLDSLFAKGKEKKYLILFANNMELRPGGGFIGSFAVVNVKDYELKEVKVYDVYDADGQLTEQIDPPEPISKYLNQTHWYLRDSAFSPNFAENFQVAETFIEKEISESDFDGGILLTTTAAQYLIQGLGDIRIPDYNETITKDNFYLKTQLYAESSFFPGSTQKKRFLSSLMNQMLLSAPSASPITMLSALERSLDEKQMVMYSKDANFQKYLDSNYWSGNLLIPRCTSGDATSCALDFIYAYDANLGVNKVNYYIERPTTVSMKMGSDGSFENTLSIVYKNGSYSDIFPGGTYKNYLQILIPPNSVINLVSINGVPTVGYDESNFSYKKIGIFLEIPPQSTKVVKLNYTLPTTIFAGDGFYQLIYQKQVGAPNYNFDFTAEFPQDVELTQSNLAPLVKGRKLNYNTSITTDKIFLVNFKR